MSGIEGWTPAERLLASIAWAGYASIDEFIARLRTDPCADTVEMPAIGDVWDIPGRRAG